MINLIRLSKKGKILLNSPESKAIINQCRNLISGGEQKQILLSIETAEKLKNAKRTNL